MMKSTCWRKKLRPSSRYPTCFLHCLPGAGQAASAPSRLQRSLLLAVTNSVQVPERPPPHLC